MPIQNSFEKRIHNAIHSSKDIGITIQDIARITSIHRITASKYLAVMEARGIIQCRHIGRAKLYLPVDSRKASDFLKQLKEGVMSA